MAKKKDKTADVEAAPARPVLTLGEHPRAQASIARTKAIAGIVGLVLGVLLSLKNGVPVADAFARGLALGVGAMVLAWGVAVVVWKQLAAAEIEVAKQKLLQRLDELEAEAAAQPQAS